MNSAVWEALAPIAQAFTRSVREHEVLRVSARIGRGGQTAQAALEKARREILVWAENRISVPLGQTAWDFESFEHVSGGRNCSAVRIRSNGSDVWAVRAEDPDKEVPGRVWTTEAVTALGGDSNPRLSLRLIASSREASLSAEPHSPGVVQQLAETCGLWRGPYQLTAEPRVVSDADDAGALAEMLVNPDRTLPVIVVSVPGNARGSYDTLLNATALTRATLGLAHVVIVPAEHTWHLTERFGKQLSTFGGAVRSYMAGFTDEADPYAHRLFLAQHLQNWDRAANAARYFRALAAHESLRRSKLGADVLAFSEIKSASLKLSRLELERKGAPDHAQLEAAKTQIAALEKQREEAKAWEETILAEQSAAEERALTAETQFNNAAYRIQQLLDQIKAQGQTPDSNIILPLTWEDVEDWCDKNLSGRLVLTNLARRGLRAPDFDEPTVAAQCLLWLANDCREALMGDGAGTIREAPVADGIRNAHCGSDEFDFQWQGRKLSATWHVKNGGNTRDPKRCFFTSRGTKLRSRLLLRTCRPIGLQTLRSAGWGDEGNVARRT